MMSQIASRHDDDHPIHLVRQDNRAVKLSRLALILVLATAAVTCFSVTYLWFKRVEKESFRRDVSIVGKKTKDLLLQTVHKKMASSTTLTRAVVSVMVATGVTDLRNFTVPGWLPLTNTYVHVESDVLVSLSPLLTSSTDLQIFQEHARLRESPLYPPCYICGENLTFTNPDAIMHYAGGDIYQACWEVEEAMLGGLSVPSEEACNFMRRLVSSTCHCGKPLENIVTENLLDPKKTDIFSLDSDGGVIQETEARKDGNPLAPIAHIGGYGIRQVPMFWNQMSDPIRERAVDAASEAAGPVFSETYMREGEIFEQYLGRSGEPGASLYIPVPADETFNTIVGVVGIDFLWSTFVTELFPINSELLTIVIANSFGQSYTFSVDTFLNDLIYVGEGDLHDQEFDDMMVASDFSEYEAAAAIVQSKFPPQDTLEYCRYRFLVYPGAEFEKKYLTNQPLYIATGIVAVFVFTLVVFMVYDSLVVRRQTKVMGYAAENASVVSSLFPPNVRSRIVHQHLRAGKSAALHNAFAESGCGFGWGNRNRMHAFLEDAAIDSDPKPIADTFKSATVIFIDLVGFTKWSSAQGAEQVFQLLEAIYSSFDRSARELGIFKIETIVSIFKASFLDVDLIWDLSQGDCYLAVCGLPDERPDHAVATALFAKKCIRHMQDVTSELSKTLGNETAALGVRCGMHSGEVVAGVLRGDKSRFQLFGDTVNSASRLESSGSPNMIHSSKETVDLLIEAGYSNWAEPREATVKLKGKGEWQTYWLNPIDECE